MPYQNKNCLGTHEAMHSPLLVSTQIRDNYSQDLSPMTPTLKRRTQESPWQTSLDVVEALDLPPAKPEEVW